MKKTRILNKAANSSEITPKKSIKSKGMKTHSDNKVYDAKRKYGDTSIFNLKKPIPNINTKKSDLQKSIEKTMKKDKRSSHAELSISKRNSNKDSKA